MMSQRLLRDGQRNAPLNLQVTLFSSKPCWSLVSGYGILRDCAERLRRSGAPVRTEFEARRLTTPAAARPC
jgi:hypothetical protein